MGVAERAWAEAAQVVGRLHLAVSRVEDLAARLEVVVGRLELLARESHYSAIAAARLAQEESAQQEPDRP